MEHQNNKLMNKETKDAFVKSSNELSTEAVEKRKSINKRIYLFGCLPIGVLLVVALVFGVMSREDNSNKTEEEKVEVDTLYKNRYIPGLAPVDVYLNMEKEGFTTKKQLSEEGNLWTSHKQYEGLDCKVHTFSDNIDSVVSVSATAMLDIYQKSPESAKFLLLFVASLPYDGANPQEAQKWVLENYNKHQASMVIGGVKFMILAPTDAVRGLRIEKESVGDVSPLEL